MAPPKIGQNMFHAERFLLRQDGFIQKSIDISFSKSKDRPEQAYELMEQYVDVANTLICAVCDRGLNQTGKLRFKCVLLGLFNLKAKLVMYFKMKRYANLPISEVAVDYYNFSN